MLELDDESKIIKNYQWLKMFVAANFPSIQPRRQPRTYFFNH